HSRRTGRVGGGTTIARIVALMRAFGRSRWTSVGTLALLVGSWSGCGKAAHTNADGGDGSISVDAIGSGARFFDVTAALHMTGGFMGQWIPGVEQLHARAGRRREGG